MTLITFYYMVATLAAITGTALALWKVQASILKRERLKERDRVWDTVSRSFVADVANNHLPHIQQCLRLIAEAMHIPLPEPPPIRWMGYRNDKSD